MPEVFSIGYQETTVDAFRSALVGAGVQHLVDVRAVAASRRPGFSKRQLAAGVEEVGIAYTHLRDLGTPADGRHAARTGRPAEMRRIYAAHLETLQAQAALATLRDLVGAGGRICLLCFERHPEHCHRLMLCEHLQAALGIEARHLLP